MRYYMKNKSRIFKLSLGTAGIVISSLSLGDSLVVLPKIDSDTGLLIRCMTNPNSLECRRGGFSGPIGMCGGGEGSTDPKEK